MKVVRQVTNVARLACCLGIMTACGISSHQSQESEQNTRFEGIALAPTTLSGFVALGDSVMAGFGVAKSAGQVSLFEKYLNQLYAGTVSLTNLTQPGTTSQDILNTQVGKAVTVLKAKAQTGAITALDAGGNDLLYFVYSNAYKSTCAQGDLKACYSAVAPILDSAERNLNTILSQLREAAGPSNSILLLTYANSKRGTGCASSLEISLFEGALEGVPNTLIAQGLNTRIRKLAVQYDASVVDVYALLQKNASTTIARDCIHPNAAGYKLIADQFIKTFETPAPTPVPSPSL